MKLLLAIALLASMSFAGDETAGTLPVVKTSYALSVGQTHSITDGIRHLIIVAPQEPGDESASATGQVHSSSWNSGGVSHTVNTTRLDNEAGPNGAARWNARHAEGLRAALALFPVDPPATGD